MSLTDVCVDRPVLAWMLMAATLVFGGVAASRIGISQFPDVDYPMVSVSLVWEGAPPEVMEHDVVIPLEEALAQVEGVRDIHSESLQGKGWIGIELDLSRDVDVALQDVQSRLSRAMRQLPRDMDPPVVGKSNPEDQPILWVGLSGPFAPQLLADTARYRVADRLQTVKGVGEITLGGYLERNIRIWVDASRLAEHALTVGDVTQALQTQHIELPAGRLETGGVEVNVRVLGEALDLQSLRQLVIKQVGAAPIRLQDVALIEDGFEDVRRLARINGQPAMGLGVRKQRGANAVAVAKGVRQAIDTLRPTLPEGMTLQISFDSTQFIEESVHEIEFEIGLAIVLTALVCWLFLGSLSSTINVVLAIPMSLLGTVAVLYFCGFTLNTFTLLALGLAVGIVVDDAIMVLENIFRHAEMGKERKRAAREGTREITFAALAATIAVVAIFSPVIFMRGLMGKFFLQFGVALSVAVLLSYVEAITLAPARCAQLLDVGKRATALGRHVDHAFDRLAAVYARWLARVLNRPGWMVALGLGLFVVAVVVLRALPAEFVPSQDQSRLLVRLQTAVGSSLDETDGIVRQAEAALHRRADVLRDFTVIGGDGVNSGFMFITLVPPDERELSQNAIAAELRRDMNAIPGLRAMVQDLSQGGFTAQRGFPVTFSIRGPDWDKLVELSTQVRTALQQSGQVVDLDSDYVVGMPELRITPNRARAADLGVSIESVASTLNALLGGVRVGKYSTAGRRIDVRLRLLAAQRTRPEDLARLQVRGRGNALVPLASLVASRESPALQAINRTNRERAINVFANVAAGHAQNEALQTVKDLTAALPAGYHAVLGGSSATFLESMSDMLFALVLGIVVAYMVLASQFNSFLHPVTVLTILPLSISGAALALTTTHKSLNIFTMIGLLLLMGIVKKNSIILVDYANQLCESGLDARAAIAQAGPVRLRPILMTSIATLMAVIPAALNLGPGAETRGPMAIAVIGGLLFSTAMSLLVVPCFYVLAARLKKRQPEAYPVLADRA